MSDLKLILEILSQIEEASKRVTRRFSKVDSSDAFLESEEGLEKLDAICMQLIAIGESLKNLDKVTNGELLPKYPQAVFEVRDCAVANHIRGILQEVKVYQIF